MKQSNEIANMNQSTQQSHHAISVWMDGDTDADMPEHLATPEGKATWELYHLIGDSLRTPSLAIPSTHSLQGRIARALEQEPAIIAVPKPDNKRETSPAVMAKHRSRFWGRNVFSGVAMAAAVASVIWVAKPFLLPEYAESTAKVAEVTPTQPVRATEVAFNTPDIRDYVSTHRDMSGLANVRQVSFGAMR